MPPVFEKSIGGKITGLVTTEGVGAIIENLPSNSKAEVNKKNTTTSQSNQSKYTEERGKENSFKLNVFKNLMYQPTYKE